MEIRDNQIFIDQKELGFLIRNCIRTYMFFNRNEMPELIVVPVIDTYKFKVDATSPEMSVSVKFAVEEKLDVTSGHSRTSRHGKAARASSSSDSNASESDE